MHIKHLLAFFTLFSSTFNKEIPSFIHVCSEDDPEINSCILNSVEIIKPFLATGVPEFNIPPLEPLIITDLISEDFSGLNILTSNVTVYGCTNFIATNLNFNLTGAYFELDVEFPKLEIHAHFEVDGKLFLVYIKGHGDFKANATDCKAHAFLKGGKYYKDGNRYLKFFELKIKAQLGETVIRLENMFNGDSRILNIVNEIVNRNLKPFIKEFMPLIEKGLSREFLRLGNIIVENFTYDQLFPSYNKSMAINDA